MTYSGSKTPLILGVMWAETIAAFVFVLARLYTRTFLVRNMGWDDHLINISMVISKISVYSICLNIAM